MTPSPQNVFLYLSTRTLKWFDKIIVTHHLFFAAKWAWRVGWTTFHSAFETCNAYLIRWSNISFKITLLKLLLQKYLLYKLYFYKENPFSDYRNGLRDVNLPSSPILVWATALTAPPPCEGYQSPLKKNDPSLKPNHSPITFSVFARRLGGGERIMLWGDKDFNPMLSF